MQFLSVDEKSLNRFWSKVKKESGVFGIDGKYPTECWLWTACVSKKGYGRFRYNKKTFNAHQFIYDAIYQNERSYYDTHHRCYTKNCVNPTHLEKLTHAKHASIENKNITHCRNGHLWIPENICIMKSGKQECRTCRRLYIGYQGNLPNTQRTHCPAGHEYNETNTYCYKNRRGCRQCRNINVKRYQQRKRHESEKD